MPIIPPPPTPPPSTFAPKPALLQPHFESYKLALPAESASVASHRLPASATAGKVSHRVQLGYKEVSRRVGWNGLYMGREKGVAVYFGAEGEAWEVRLKDDMTPFFRELFILPTPLATTPSTQHSDVPSALSLSPTTWALADGTGRLYLVDSSSAASASPAEYELTSPSGELVPFLLHAADGADGAVISCCVRKDGEGTSSQRTRFEVLGVRFEGGTSGQPTPLEVRWRVRGEQSPVVVQRVDGDAWLLGAAAPFKPVRDEEEHIAPVPLEPAPAPEEPAPSPAQKFPPPYSWSQTHTTVTITIPLPSRSVPKASLTPSYTSTTFASSLLPFTSPTPAALWAPIKPGESTWTVDRARGLVEVDLEKRDEGTRWVQLFETGQGGPERGVVSVDETMSDAERRAALEALEKYTVEGEGDADPVLRSGGVDDMPSLGKGEIDESVDSSVGKQVVFTFVPAASPANTRTFPQQETLLSLPLTGTSAPPSLILSHPASLSGLLFTPPPNPEHTKTFPALPFVLASKRDLRFTYHVPHAVLALEGGSTSGGAGNAYVYYETPHEAKQGRQGLVQVGGKGRGPVVGVGGLDANGQGTVVLALCEEELVVLQGVV